MDVEVTVKNSVKCKQSPVYSGSLIVGVASVAKCWLLATKKPKVRVRRELYFLRVLSI